ncbi:hypothetical protein HZ994_07165 [Akkermansiaceae bacterium]|nr:hypothetical protein HZ994_07165 [Akkermansiaceae bacterium]
MNPHPTFIALSFALCLPACEKDGKASPEAAPSSPIALDIKAADMPILPVKKGDFWKYDLRVEIPAGITSEGSAAVELDNEMTRTFLGKIAVSEKLPDSQAFDVVIPGQETVREYVDILEDRVMMLGTGKPDVPGAKPLWLSTAIPFVIAGMRPGQEVAPFSIQEGAINREIRVVAREAVEVPTGKHRAIRLLMVGNDGQFDIRKTTWFAPGIGIVKEEKTRYVGDRLIYRETAVLTETSVSIP